MELPNEILDCISDSLAPEDVARLSLAICDQRIIRERRKKEFDVEFAKKMRILWHGRFAMYSEMFNHPNGFWVGEDFGASRTFGKFDTNIFRGWTVALKRNTLFLMTRVLDEVVNIAVDLGFPSGSVGPGDVVHFTFDIIQTSHPVDIDAYAPPGKLWKIVFDFYRYSCSQKGVHNSVGDTIWTNVIPWSDKITYLKNSLPGWHARDIGYSENEFRTCIGGVYVELTKGGYVSFGTECWRAGNPLDGAIHVNMNTQKSWVFGGIPERKIMKVVHYLLGPIHIDKVKPMKVIIRGETDVFYSWGELSQVSKIGIATLKKFENHGVINFDKQTYKRKPITFSLATVSI